MKKILALLIAVMMLSAMVGALATDIQTPTSGVAPAVDLTSVEFSIGKDIYLFNVDASQIYEPNITYTYSIAPVTVSNGTVVTGLTAITTDENDVTATVAVRNGIANGVKIKGNGTSDEYALTASVVFGDGTNTKVNTTKEGLTASAKVTENLNFKIYPDTIYNNGANAAGVYRYLITDTTSTLTQNVDPRTNAGVVKP